MHNNIHLAFLLADLGYYVWMGNFRGNRYSCRQVKRRNFWNFAWHKMGLIDLPTMIDYIMAVNSALSINPLYWAFARNNLVFYYMLGAA